MSSPQQSVSEFDLQPDPRILPMLGEITLPQWRCIAEFIDNSVDGFLSAKRSGHDIGIPEVHVSLPTSDSPTGRVTVTDNGPGMDPSTLEKAVRAGWTSNDPIHNLGMFGMGFNIATARLGSVTKVWTTRAGDKEWHGLEIDFDALIRQRHFKTPRLTRPKIDPHEHGTEVIVERLKPEQRQWFSRTPNRSKMSDMFEVAYSAMLRPNGVPTSFTLRVNGNIVRGRSHCIWGGEGSPQRQVTTSRYGVVSAYQPVRVDLPNRSFCMKCWQWLSADDTKCPACDSADNVIVRQRGVYGWLGMQRYLSDTEFGIDFVRNGRKIETANKDLFVWDGGGKVEPEYPIDDPRNRGRIVGEIHIDHCRVTYTKDRFDRNDPAWEEMVRIIRGSGPLRPDRAAEMGFGPNNSPLFLLFQAFRRNNPHTKVAGAYSKLLIVKDNDTAAAMAKRFYAGEAEYQSDTKWWDLVEEADRELLTPSAPVAATGGGQPLPGFGAGASASPQATPPEPAPVSAPPIKQPIASLSREYRDQASGLRWEVSAFSVEQSDPLLTNGAPWSLKATPGGTHDFSVCVTHPVFRSATMTPLDGLLSELAWSAMDFLRTRRTELNFAAILACLRRDYAGVSKLDPVALSGEATTVLNTIAHSLSKSIAPEDARPLFEELTPLEQDAVHQKLAGRSVQNPQKVINQGRFLEFAPRETLLRFVERHPDLFFDGRLWDAPYATLDFERPSATEAARRSVLNYYLALMRDTVWLAEQDVAELNAASRPRMLRAALALELLAREPEESS
jgi:hypothetical protein